MPRCDTVLVSAWLQHSICVLVVSFVQACFIMFLKSAVAILRMFLRMPFPDNSFDLIWSLESGEHMPQKAKILSPNCFTLVHTVSHLTENHVYHAMFKGHASYTSWNFQNLNVKSLRFMSEMHRVCKPGGRIILVTWVHRDLADGESLKPKDRGLGWTRVACETVWWNSWRIDKILEETSCIYYSICISIHVCTGHTHTHIHNTQTNRASNSKQRETRFNRYIKSDRTWWNQFCIVVWTGKLDRCCFLMLFAFEVNTETDACRIVFPIFLHSRAKYNTLNYMIEYWSEFDRKCLGRMNQEQRLLDRISKAYHLPEWCSILAFEPQPWPPLAMSCTFSFVRTPDLNLWMFCSVLALLILLRDRFWRHFGLLHNSNTRSGNDRLALTICIYVAQQKIGMWHSRAYFNQAATKRASQ